jgi:hypothetical protein
MNEIRAITEKSELEGTAYVELLPGKYKDLCWNDGSLFFEEEVFGYFEPCIKRHVPDFDHYAFTEMDASQCALVASGLRDMAVLVQSATRVEQLQKHVGFIFQGSEQRFENDLPENVSVLARLAEELADWLVVQASSHEHVSILGL